MHHTYFCRKINMLVMKCSNLETLGFLDNQWGCLTLTQVMTSFMHDSLCKRKILLEIPMTYFMTYQKLPEQSEDHLHICHQFHTN